MIDAHHHVWDLSVRDQDWITGPELAPLRRNFGIEDLPAETNGVTATVLVQTVTAAEETPELLALAAGHHLVAAVVGWTDLTAPSAADDLAALRALPNVTCKLSGLVTEADRATWTVADLRPYAEVVLEAFGPDRVMFGSDWPVCLLAAPYGKVVETAGALLAGLSADERAQVFGGVAARVYGIGRAAG
ncbi:amidohydrolase family protein [Planomonospora corallina]|uniref:Amidohydrolase family protein n=1 Tax=Planomonospora corallina TaxID=1806052 RepID=A0ABV8I5X9_9ACTN